MKSAESNHPGLAEVFAPNLVSGSEIIEDEYVLMAVYKVRDHLM